jgi:hypothetical protein
LLGAQSGAQAHCDSRTFVETTVRPHRAGEGAPYTGLKPAGVHAPASRDLRQVKAVLAEEMEHGLTHRLEAVRNAAAHTAEAKTADQVPAERERISAELGFVTYVEGVRQVIYGVPAGHEHN